MHMSAVRASFSCSHRDPVRKELHGHSYVVWVYWPSWPVRDQMLLQRNVEEVVKAHLDHKTLPERITRAEDIAAELGGLIVDVHSIMIERPVEGFRVLWQAPAKEKVNVYQREFVAICPNNKQPITYQLMIATDDKVIMVEDIVAATDKITRGYHEDIADLLYAEFGGKQVLSAHHHGVTIETVRGA